MQLSKFKLFTMVELIAVISIMAILLSMTIRTMKTDSTTTNVVLLGSTLKYAQVYSMSSLSDDEVVEVTVTSGAIKVDVLDTVTLERTLIREKSFFKSSEVVEGVGVYQFNRAGVPDTAGVTTFIVKSVRSETEALVRLRPFMGKVVYY